MAMASDDRFRCEWERGALIGEGAFGSVFLAHPKSSSSVSRDSGLLLPPVFAVKSAEILFSETIENEIEVFNDLQSSGSSPYIITCFGEEFTVNGNGNTVYNLLLEYASGGSLAHVIKKLLWRWMPVEQVKRYTRQLLLGLSHIHDSGYVHCDIKPDNVLLVPSEDGDFVAKIADFGLAKRRGREFDHVKGTPRYLAPESVVHGVQDCASDIWALGCTVYEMLTGYSVWPLDFNTTTDDLYHKIASEDPHLNFRFPVETEDFLRACFVRTPAERPTAKMLLEHPFLTGLIEEQKEEFWGKVDENGCQQVEAENCRVKEEVKVIETGCMFKDDWIFVPREGFMLVLCSLSKDDMTLPACKRRRISHLHPLTASDLTLTLAPPPCKRTRISHLNPLTASDLTLTLALPACKRRRISHLNPVTSDDLTLRLSLPIPAGI